MSTLQKEYAEEAINLLHADSAASSEQILEELRDLRSHIDVLIEAIEVDIKRALEELDV